MSDAPLTIDQALQQAISHHQAARLPEAERLYRAILQAQPQHPDANHNLGILAVQVGKPEAGLPHFKAALEANPTQGQYWLSFIDTLLAVGRINEAQASLAQGAMNALTGPTAIKLKEKLSRSVAVSEMFARAFGLYKSMDRIKAEQLFRDILVLDPDHADCLHYLGVINYETGRPEEAILLIRRALAVNPSYAGAYINLGNALQEVGNFAEAVMSYRQALALQPNFAMAHNNLGNALKELGKLDEALTCYRRAIELKPDYANAHNNLGIGLLLSGYWREGFAEYQWRWQVESWPCKMPVLAGPPWEGECLSGKTILVHCEQGLGDSIHFIRFVKPLAEMAACVRVLVPPRLGRLFRSIPGVNLVTAVPEAGSYDCHLPLMCLPRVLETTPETLASVVPYLRPEPVRVAAWRNRLPSSGFRIGIAWQGNPKGSAEKGRSAPLACFAPLARIAGVRLISLQKGPGLDQLDRLPAGMVVETLGADFDTGPDAFLDTAAVMMGLDLIVTIDTAIGHLAGAHGRPVWLALQAVPHWVWMLEREDTPWYPEMRLFRQSSRGDWREVFERMAAKLEQLVVNRTLT